MIQTATISVNQIFNPSEAQILEALRLSMSHVVKILSVDRALFSGRYVVTFENNLEFTDQNLRTAFLFALQSSGYSGEIIAIDAGSVSSAPGGIGQAGKEVIGEIKGPLGTVAVIAVAAAVIVGLFYLSPYLKKG